MAAFRPPDYLEWASLCKKPHFNASRPPALSSSGSSPAPPKAAEELRQPLWLAVSLGFRLDCLQAPLVRSALRATIGSRPDATPRALTAGLFFSRSFFSRLDWHSHSRPPRFTSPIVPLMGNRINPVCYGSGEVFFSWGRGSETRCGPRNSREYPLAQGKSHGNTKTGHLHDHGARFQEGWGIPWTPVWPGVGIVVAWFAAGDWDGRHSLRGTQPARISDPKQHVHAATAQPNYIAPNIRVRS